jgi:hypothetical protein
VVAVSCTLKSERPAITSVTASAAPLNGTCCAVKPALARNRSMPKCDADPTGDADDARILARGVRLHSIRVGIALGLFSTT